MEVRLISCPSMSGDALCDMAAAECYQGEPCGKALRVALKNQHLSVAEHAAFTFRITGVSRILLAQLTRHRIASYSVQSQRYCGVKPEWIVPQTIKDAHYDAEYIAVCNAVYAFMVEMMEHGVPAEDARYVIPHGVTCSLLVTMNARELMHFFELRCCNRAQWEIRDMACQMLALCKIAAPELFKNAGPGCLRKGCPEGKMSCGKPWKG